MSIVTMIEECPRNRLIASGWTPWLIRMATAVWRKAWRLAPLLLPYLMLLALAATIWQSAPERPRPYRLPGGPVVAAACAWVCGLMLGGAMLLFAYTPGEGMQWPVAIGALTVMAIGEGVIRVAERSRVVRG